MTIYERHALELVKDILPSDDLHTLIQIFMDSASIDMGADYEDATLKRIVYIIRTEFAFMPLCFVASGFSQGAMGKYGPGRLVPRTIHGWMNEVALEYNRKVAKDRQDELNAVELTTYDLVRYPIGKAIIKKIEFYESGLLNDDNWDLINLKELAEAISLKKEIRFNNFYKIT